MRDTIHRAGGDAPVPVVRLAGPLDRDAADRLAPDLLGCESGLVVVDGREVPQASAAGLAALADLADRVRTWPGAGLVLVGRRPLADAVSAAGYADRLPVCPSVRQARATAGSRYGPLVRRRLPGTALAAPVARHLVTEVCRSWGLPTVCDRAELVTAELVANAVRYAGRGIELAVSLRPGELGIRVRDGDPRAPDALPRAGPEAEHGRGLHLVAALARAWGSAPLRDDGKVVWASIPVPG